MKPPTALSYIDLIGEEKKTFDRFFNKENSMIEVNPGKIILPIIYRQMGDDILNLPIHESDVWLCSYPRTGSTWAQEMVWLIGNDLDFERAKAVQQIRCPLVELTALIQEHHSEWHQESVSGTSVDLVRNLAEPRYVRSHLPWGLLPKDLNKDDNSVKAKVIYTARNPKDIVVSFYHYCVLVHNLNGTLEEFCELSLQGRGIYGNIWEHILSFWAKRHDPNVLFLKYEDMKNDLPGVISKTAAFLGKNLDDNQMEALCDHLSFDKIKNNKAVNLEPLIERSKGKDYLEHTDLRFIRKGEIGDWKNHMSEKMAIRFDEWADERIKGTDLSFD